ncbi:MAG TPA: alpha/beta hydrolase [Vicinamibacterales bacterium]|nr:alpha/beta hydrolase [Vicinamibacterales bacterium]
MKHSARLIASTCAATTIVLLTALPAAAQSALGSGVSPTSLKIVGDVDYVANADYADGKDRLDIYVPDGARNTPVIFSIHGGALEAGDRSEERFVGQRFAGAGYVTVVISYRLSPDVSHPAHIQDVAAAFAWVTHNIARHGGDPNRILVIGHSAGAYLAMLLATDPRWLAAHNLTPRDIAAVAPVSGFYWVEREGVAPDRPAYVWGRDRKAWVEASPAHYLRPDTPPVLLLDTDGDEGWRQQQKADFATALRAAGDTDVTVYKVRGRTHMSVWTEMNDSEREETSSQILRFAKRLFATP